MVMYRLTLTQTVADADDTEVAHARCVCVCGFTCHEQVPVTRRRPVQGPDAATAPPTAVVAAGVSDGHAEGVHSISSAQVAQANATIFRAACYQSCLHTCKQNKHQSTPQSCKHSNDFQI